MNAVKLSALSRWIIAGTALAAGACAPVSQAAVGDPVLNSGSQAQAQAQKQAQTERVVAFGYRTIVQRHLNGEDAAAMAVQGLKGLSSLDSEFDARLQGPFLELIHGGHVFTRYAAPAADDVAGWADVTARAFEAARGVSPELGNARDEAFYEAVFDSVLASLDKFSRYYTAAEAQENRASRNGFGGIGISYRPEEAGLQISSVMEESPAAEAKLQVGDVLTHIDGVSVTGMEPEEISRRLRGAIATQVQVTILRPSEPKPIQVTLQRSLVVPPTVSMALEDGIATLRISGFNQRTAASAAREVEKAIRLSQDGLKGVILDLRGNPGGLLDQGVAVADLFIPEGRIVFTRGRHRHANQSYSASRGDMGESLPLVVLVDGRSASASEILAAALQDSGRAVLIGTNSYGKGTVQTVVRMPNDGEMTLTWSRFHSPTGYALHGLGVMPTICTSGEADQEALLRRVQSGTVRIADALPQWREVSVEEKEARESLRAACPKERHEDGALEMALARALLENPALYARALSYTAPQELRAAGLE